MIPYLLLHAQPTDRRVPDNRPAENARRNVVPQSTNTRLAAIGMGGGLVGGVLFGSVVAGAVDVILHRPVPVRLAVGVGLAAIPAAGAVSVLLARQGDPAVVDRRAGAMATWGLTGAGLSAAGLGTLMLAVGLRGVPVYRGVAGMIPVGLAAGMVGGYLVSS